MKFSRTKHNIIKIIKIYKKYKITEDTHTNEQRGDKAGREGGINHAGSPGFSPPQAADCISFRAQRSNGMMLLMMINGSYFSFC